MRGPPGELQAVRATSAEAGLGGVMGADAGRKDRRPPGAPLPPVPTEASSRLVLTERRHSR